MKNPVVKGCFFIGKISPRLRESGIATAVITKMIADRTTGRKYLGSGAFYFGGNYEEKTI